MSVPDSHHRHAGIRRDAGTCPSRFLGAVIGAILAGALPWAPPAVAVTGPAAGAVYSQASPAEDFSLPALAEPVPADAPAVSLEHTGMPPGQTASTLSTVAFLVLAGAAVFILLWTILRRLRGGRRRRAAETAPRTIMADTVPVADAVPPPADTAPQDDDALADFTIAAVAQYLVQGKAAVAIAVSPRGDEGSTATVMLAREIAGLNRSTVLIDMTGSGFPTRLMAESASLAGVTDLLSGDVAFGEAIHRDRLSQAHIVPRGNADVESALRGADSLDVVIEALSDAYDLVLIECGPASMSGLARLAHVQGSEVVLAVPGFSRDEIAGLVAEFRAAGYDNLLVIAGTGDPGAPRWRREAA